MRLAIAVFSFALAINSAAFGQSEITRFYDPQISLAEALKDMRQSGQNKDLAQTLRAMLSKTVLINLTDDQLNAALAELEKAGGSANTKNRFPVVSLGLFNEFNRARSQQLLSLQKQTAPAPVRDINLDLATLTATTCNHAVVQPQTLAPGIQEGSFEDPNMTACQIEKGIALKNVLNRLAAGEFEKAPLTFLGKPIATAPDLITTILDDGHGHVHTIKVSDGRTYANFLDFIYNGKSVVMPIWMDTGLTLANGNKIIVPTGHSEWIWQISGPTIDTSIRFFQGEDGLGFASNEDLRPRWSGYVSYLRADSSVANGRDTVIRSIAVAAGVLRRNRAESKGLYDDGYGYTGVCDDSTALIDATLFSEYTVYPLLRHPDLLHAPLPTIGDGLDDIFASANKLLVSDIPGADPVTAASRRFALQRLLLMQPTSPGNLIQLDPVLAGDLGRIHEELLKTTAPQ